MSLINAKEMYELSFKRDFSLAAFNVYNMESLQAVIWACEKEKSPAIVQMSNGARRYIKDTDEFLTYVRNMLENSTASFVLHHDHLFSVEEAKDAIDKGFQSVMFDGSSLPYEENIKCIKEISEYGKSNDVWVEAELGSIPGFEDDYFVEKAQYTDVSKVNDFIDKSGCNSLAVSVGTAHGGVLSDKHLPIDFDVLQEILNVRKGYPFVLHGAASMPNELIENVNKYGGEVGNHKICSEDDILKACRLGIKKANMDVDNFLVHTAAVRKFLIENPDVYDPRKYLGIARDEFMKQVRHKLTSVVHSSRADI